MTTQETVDALLKLAEIATACVWPVTLLLVLYLFRAAIRAFLPELARRLQRAEIAGTTLEFSEIAVDALQEAIETGAQEYKDEPEKLASFVRNQVSKLPDVRAFASPEAQPRLKRRIILWVDDNPMNNVYESNLLKRLGADVYPVRSTQEALAFLEQNPCDLVISDLSRVEGEREKPEAGYELLDALNRRDQQVPLIFYTGQAARMNKKRIRAAHGAADHPSQLIDLTMRALQAGPRGEE